MRKSPVITALFPKVRGEVLEAALLQPEREWYLSELAHHLHTRPSSLQREVESLSRAGILALRRDVGRRLYLRGDVNSPVFAELSGLLTKTSGIIPTLRQEFEPLGDKITFAFVYGSVARSEEHSNSDVDLMLVGKLGLSDAVPALRKAERRLGRQVNPTVFSDAEFSRKLRRHDHFLETVMAGDKQFIKGNADELVAAIG